MRTSPEGLQSVVNDLLVSGPEVHVEEGRPVQWTLGVDTLMWLAKRIPSCSRTIETGCGYSTVLFAAAGIEHTAITPNEDEILRIQRYCESRGIRMDRVNFLVGTSQQLLPSLDIRPTDLALIDGAHAFPVPCLDWYFTSPSLRVGGLLVLDDWRIPSVGFLVDFLRAEPPTWREVDQVGNAIVFEKTADEDRTCDWKGQYVNRRVGIPPFPRRLRLKVRKTLRDLRGQERG